MLDHGAIGAPHAEQVDRQRALDLLDWRGGQSPVELDTGVGDRDIDRPKTLDRAADRPLQCLVVGDVDLEAHGAIAELGGELLQALGLQADERHVGALCVKAPCRLRADPACGAGDEHGASVDIKRCGDLSAHAVRGSLRGSRS